LVESFLGLIERPLQTLKLVNANDGLAETLGRLSLITTTSLQQLEVHVIGTPLVHIQMMETLLSRATSCTRLEFNIIDAITDDSEELVVTWPHVRQVSLMANIMRRIRWSTPSLESLTMLTMTPSQLRSVLQVRSLRKLDVPAGIGQLGDTIDTEFEATSASWPSCNLTSLASDTGNLGLLLILDRWISLRELNLTFSHRVTPSVAAWLLNDLTNLTLLRVLATPHSPITTVELGRLSRTPYSIIEAPNLIELGVSAADDTFFASLMAPKLERLQLTHTAVTCRGLRPFLDRHVATLWELTLDYNESMDACYLGNNMSGTQLKITDLYLRTVSSRVIAAALAACRHVRSLWLIPLDTSTLHALTMVSSSLTMLDATDRDSQAIVINESHLPQLTLLCTRLPQLRELHLGDIRDDMLTGVLKLVKKINALRRPQTLKGILAMNGQLNNSLSSSSSSTSMSHEGRAVELCLIPSTVTASRA
jgi:hypothetical protein